MDGVYVEEQGELSFHPLPCLGNSDVADILQIACTRILRLLRRQGVVEDDSVNADETLADTEPALAELAVASTLGRVPAGPALRQKDPIRLRPGRDLEHPKGLCATLQGFSLHAATTARADDDAGREALCKYILRPPIAQENLQLSSDDLVRLQLKRPFSDGTFALDLDPLSLLVRLATTVPPPRFNTVRYAGILAAASKWRADAVTPVCAWHDGRQESDVSGFDPSRKCSGAEDHAVTAQQRGLVAGMPWLSSGEVARVVGGALILWGRAPRAVANVRRDVALGADPVIAEGGITPAAVVVRDLERDTLHPRSEPYDTLGPRSRNDYRTAAGTGTRGLKRSRTSS